MPDFGDRVADRQGEGHGPAKAREPHHVLELKQTKLSLFSLLNLFYSILPSIYSAFYILFLLSLVSVLLSLPVHLSLFLLFIECLIDLLLDKHKRVVC